MGTTNANDVDGAESNSVLVVEDDVQNAKLLQKTLKQMGYKVISVISSGEAAIDSISKEKPDLVLIDIKLKGMMNGIQAAEAIRKTYGLPVVYITDCVDREILKRARVTEPFGYIQKPVKARELNMAIEMALYKHLTEKKIKEENQKSRKIMEKAFFDLTKTMCKVFEYRDCYTAGHQNRVAELAVLTGRHMGLDEDHINELYIGGMLHDIGKIGIPIEILTKTSLLTPVEFALIRSIHRLVMIF